NCGQRAQSELECARKVCGAVFIGKRKGLFRAQAEPLCFIVVSNVTARGLRPPATPAHSVHRCASLPPVRQKSSARQPMLCTTRVARQLQPFPREPRRLSRRRTGRRKRSIYPCQVMEAVQKP